MIFAVKNRRLTILVAARFSIFLLTLFLSPNLLATNIELNVTDLPDQGLNDPTPASPVGGNFGATLGEQRRIVFKHAAAVWSSIVDSDIVIRVDASFKPLTCTPTSAVLGSASPNTLHLNFPGRPVANTLYVQAQANALAAFDLSTNSDLAITFNSSIDNNNNCLQNINWYYGLDSNGPPNSVDLFSVVLHEFAHGLGFATFVDLTTGAKYAGFDDAFMRLLEDHSEGQTWNQLSDSYRVLSAADDPDLHWAGNNVNAVAVSLSSGLDQGHVRNHGPSTIALGSSVSHFSSALTPNELMEPIITGSKPNVGFARQLLQDIGWPIFPSNSPVLSPLPNVGKYDSETTTHTFVVSDNDSSIGNVTTTASSSNQAIVSDAQLMITGSSSARELTINPQANTQGTVTITVAANDGINISQELFELSVIFNQPPVISVLSPQDESTSFVSNVTLNAQASDAEDGGLSAQISWQSSIDGALGIGATIAINLSDGLHLISASVNDNHGKSAIVNVTATVDANGDYDGDSLSNSLEILLNTDPTNADSDNDGISDYDEVNRDGDPESYTPNLDTDPNNNDTDGDGILDGNDPYPLIASQRDEAIPFPLWSYLLLVSLLSFFTRKHNKALTRLRE